MVKSCAQYSRFRFGENLLQLPELVLPKLKHDLQRADALYPPSHLDGVVLGVFGDFEDLQRHIGEL